MADEENTNIHISFFFYIYISIYIYKGTAYARLTNTYLLLSMLNMDQIPIYCVVVAFSTPEVTLRHFIIFRDPKARNFIYMDGRSVAWRIS
jgi:hypothetical protein